MATELADKRTPVTCQQMADALYTAWCGYFNSPPASKSIMVLLAQWALETGRGKQMHNYNVGNVKARPDGSYDFQYFACNELLGTATAKQLQAADPKTARITRDNGNGTCWIWFYPKNAGCCFRAFEQLDDGVFDYLSMMVGHKTFKRAWPAVLAGSPAQFSHLLKQAGYYTGDEQTYTRAVVSLFKEFTNSIKLPDPITFTPDEQQNFRNQVTQNLQMAASEWMTACRGEPEDENA